jgi:hypothetical protein
MFFQFAKHVKVQGNEVGAVHGGEVQSRNGFRSRTYPSTASDWKISLYVLTSALTNLETMWKNRGLMSKHMCAFLASTYLHSHKKNREPYFLTSLHTRRNTVKSTCKVSLESNTFEH